MKLALIFPVEARSISSQGKQGWVEKGGAVAPPGSSHSSRAQETGWCMGCSGSCSLPSSTWPESQTAPERKWERSETHPIFSCIGSKTQNQARCWQKHSRPKPGRLQAFLWKTKRQGDGLDCCLSSHFVLRLMEIRAWTIFFFPPDLTKHAVLETKCWKWPTAHGFHSTRENSALHTFVKNAWACPKGVPESY